VPQDDTHGRPQEQQGDPKDPGRWDRVKVFFGEVDGRLSVVKGLTAVTVLSSIFVGYFQYLNAYQDKVSAQAKEDMTSATTTFTDISRAFSEAQTLQQILYLDFTNAIKDKTDTSDQALSTKNARGASEAYEKARTALRQNIDVLVRRAEIYIDWASDIGRDSAGKRNVDSDPLTRSVLRDYDFSCSDKSNFPRFGNVDATKTADDRQSDEDFCTADAKHADDSEITPDKALSRICTMKNGSRTTTRVYWYSAKHHVLTMHYCFEAAHDRLQVVRDWASNSERNSAKEKQFLAEPDQIRAELDGLAQRLNAFMSLALFQMERIRVKYRPVGFVCSVPLVRDMLSARCLPVRTAATPNH
jgi:hypothetical protein